LFRSPFALALLLMLVGPAIAQAADKFPRGEGFYFSPFKLLAVLVVYFAWLRTCWWVNQDAQELKLPTETWNPVLLGAGLVGLLLVWLLPWFWLGVVVFLVLYLAATLTYVGLRNEGLAEDQKVLTPTHLRHLVNRWFRLGLREPQQAQVKQIPVRFVGKRSGGGRGDDASRVARAQESKGYRAALEMVHDALQKRATDIHLEPTKEEMIVRFRIDGILQATTPFARAMGDAVINIFKVLAELDITEKRKPQDGSFSAEVLGIAAEGEEEVLPARQVDFRVATAGSVVGEKMVMRILDPARQVARLKQVGMRERMRELVHSLVTQPHGLFIVCGPTGAGKSTTLYSCLSEIDRFQKNVITVENPVEYHIENVTQIEINPKAGKTFASELRSILRQDPDVIYIGEIRDKETAEIACQAAQTGHMVFTTLHANDTVTALGRLIDLGVQPFMVANSVTAVLGQRLVRVLCPKCKEKYRPNPELLRRANLPADKIKFFYRPPENGGADEEAGEDGEESGDRRGQCEMCGGSGYRGRTGIFELLVLTDPIRDLIRENPNFNAIRQEAVKAGLKTLQEDGLRVVIEGTTSIHELLRVSK
jgi:general secretion pathway protein E